MTYPDGTTIRPGDVVSIDSKYRGRVVASMDTNEYLSGQDSWAYLSNGIMVDTDFAGLVHYTSEASMSLSLIERFSAA